MKTYNLFYVLLLALLFNCSKSDDNGNTEEDKSGVEANYTVLLRNDGSISSQLLNANADSLSLNFSQNSFGSKEMPEMAQIHGTSFLQYYKIDNCSGKIELTNFIANTTTEMVVFKDLNECELTATAISAFEDLIVISYVLQNIDEPRYVVRLIDTQTSENNYVDIQLTKKPLDLEFANNRLFVLTIDEEVTDENGISVIDLSSNTVLHEDRLGNDAQRIFKDGDDNIIISYPELHGILNSTTMDIVFTRYEENKAPNFVSAVTNKLDSSGKLYYPAVSGVYSMYDEIPAVFDFSINTTTLYAFENFLTEDKRTEEYNIQTSTAVSYDEGNNLIVIGYKKSGSANTGGILRIKPAPNAEFVDHIDLNGIPFEIIVY